MPGDGHRVTAAWFEFFLRLGVRHPGTIHVLYLSWQHDPPYVDTSIRLGYLSGAGILVEEVIGFHSAVYRPYMRWHFLSVATAMKAESVCSCCWTEICTDRLEIFAESAG